MQARTWYGIDFSGNYRKWSPGCRTSNVWVARAEGQPDALTLRSLDRVQDLEGEDHPFSRLLLLLKRGHFTAACIDAQLSVPSVFVPDARHAALLDCVAGLPLTPEAQPFPSGPQLVSALTTTDELVEALARNPKPLRRTECYWHERGLSVRSAMWAGSRPGAPMCAAALKLVSELRGQLWPWKRSGPSLVGESFPMAQLLTWKLPRVGYGKSTEKARKLREDIVAQLKMRIELGPFEALAVDHPDALDAVICALSATGLPHEDLLQSPPEAEAEVEGWIAVVK